MQRRWVTIPQAIQVTVAGLLLATPATAIAQSLPGPGGPLIPPTIAPIAADLAYPTNAQRFFEAGRAQLEQEIRRLSEHDEPTDPLLTIQPDVLKQFEDPRSEI